MSKRVNLNKFASVKQKTITKYFRVLQQLKKELAAKPVFQITEWLHEQSAVREVSAYLLKSRIIEKRGNEYHWRAGEPTTAMTAQMLQQINSDRFNQQHSAKK